MGRYRWVDWRLVVALAVCAVVLLVAFLMQM
jgi:low affinity Fe/Cu permease